MKTRLLLLILYLTLQHSFSQENIFVGAQSDNIDKTVYTAMQNIWYANEQISYLCPLPIINNQISPNIPLREGEGRTEKYILEGSLYHQIPIAMGRNQSNHFWQTSRITFDYGFNIRMAQDKSNPLLPNNNIIGLTVNKIIWNSYTKKSNFKIDSLFYSYENWNEKKLALQNISLEFTAHHYSNGQQEGFFVYDTIDGTPHTRNDYLKGDFSTNYLKLGCTYSYLSRARNLFSVNLTYQYDGSLFGPLVYSDEQEKSYGHHRLKSFAQFRWLLRFSRVKDYQTYDYAKQTKVKINMKRYGEAVVRWEHEYILDNNLDNYTIPSGKHKFNQHLYLQYTQPNWRNFGFLIHAYYGRDYSNIRYDLPVFAIMGGFSINFNKYKTPLSQDERYINKSN